MLDSIEFFLVRLSHSLLLNNNNLNLRGIIVKLFIKKKYFFVFPIKEGFSNKL
jgi:hypothetical protein